jgi:hypothetical protein
MMPVPPVEFMSGGGNDLVREHSEAGYIHEKDYLNV